MALFSDLKNSYTVNPKSQKHSIIASLDETVGYTICRIEAISIYNRLKSVSEQDKNHNALFLMLYI